MRGVDLKSKKKIAKTNWKLIYDISDFKKWKNDLVVSRKDFEIISHQGEVKKILYNTHTLTFANKDFCNGKGYHICKQVSDSVNKFIDNNPNYQYKKYPTLEPQHIGFNSKAIVTNVNNDIYAIDVSDCYWDTMYMKGFISKTLWLTAMKNDDWKIGRNTSIGALGKVEYKTSYKNGVQADKVEIERDVRRAYIRQEIIWSVHEMFLELIKLMGDDCLMYFTDCIYVPFGRAERVSNFYKEKGYNSKTKIYWLKSVDNNKVIWWDYARSKQKSYMFNERQEFKNILP